MKYLFCLSLLSFFISGCGEFAYKRGASAKDLEEAKKYCQSAGKEAAIEKCLEDNGWVVQKLDKLGVPDSELFATASVAEDDRSMSKTNKASTDQASTDTQKTNASSNTSAEVTPKPTDTAKPNAPANLLETFKITSWWKIGAGQANLDEDISACSKELGEAHIPDRKTQTFTRGFALCMYKKDWRGLRQK